MSALEDAQNKYDILLASNAPDTQLLKLEQLIDELRATEKRENKRAAVLEAKAIADAKAEQLRLATEQVKLHDGLFKTLSQKLKDVEPLLKQIVDAAASIDVDVVRIREHTVMAKHHGVSIQYTALPKPDVNQAWLALKSLAAQHNGGSM